MGASPVLSPYPATHTCGCVMPSSMAARVLAVAKPKSLWHLTDNNLLSFVRSERPSLTREMR